MAFVADHMNAGDQAIAAGCGSGCGACALALRPTPMGIIDRIGRVLRKRMQDVGQHQFLMLLLVIEPDLDDRDDRFDVPYGFDQRRHRVIDMGAISCRLRDTGACD